MIVFLGLPLYVVIHASLTTESNQFTFDNFKQTWDSPGYRLAFKNSLILSVWTSIVGAVFGTWLAAAVVTAKPGGLLHRITQSGSGVLAYFAGRTPGIRLHRRARPDGASSRCCSSTSASTCTPTASTSPR